MTILCSWSYADVLFWHGYGSCIMFGSYGVNNVLVELTMDMLCWWSYGDCIDCANYGSYIVLLS